MRPTKIPPVGVAPHAARSMEYNSSSAAKVIPLRPNLNYGVPFDRLTARLVIDQYRNGTLSEGVIVALLASAGLQP